MNLRDVETKPFEPSEAHRRLQRLAGGYRGLAKTWIEPGAPAEEAPWEGLIEPILGGRFVRFEYRSRLLGGPIAGLMVLGFEKDRAEFQLSWIDSLHTGSATMLSTGPDVAGDQPISVRGRYFVAQTQEYWGWRTEIDDLGNGPLVVRMFNVTPDGQEDLGVEIALERVEG